MNEDLTLFMPTQHEIDEMISVGNMILRWEALDPSGRILDHETTY